MRIFGSCWTRSLTGLGALALVASSAMTIAAPISWGELDKLPLPPPGEHINYGPAPQQFGELRVPTGKGPFPVMVILHGGCWQAEYDYVYITRLAAWMTARGIATWTPEYRRIGDDGGGWPGTFLDVAFALDSLRTMARDKPLDLGHVAVAGHSAGGHLALWLASRAHLPPDSPLYSKTPLAIQGVLGLAAITDLTTYRIGPPGSCHSSVDALLGGTPATVPKRYAETSPMQRLPLGVPQVFLQGDLDPIVDPVSVRDYVSAAKAAGDSAMILPLADAGHFDTAVPIPASEAALEQALHLLLPQATQSVPK